MQLEKALGRTALRASQHRGRKHFSGLKEPEFRWSGQVIESVDGLAFIGRNPGDELNVYLATGDSGAELTHGTIAGMLLTFDLGS